MASFISTFLLLSLLTVGSAQTALKELSIDAFRWSQDTECIPPRTSGGAIRITHELNPCSGHVQKPRNMADAQNTFWLETALAKDTQRFKAPPFSANENEYQDWLYSLQKVPLGPYKSNTLGNYIIDAGFGTPLQNVQVYVDTGSDVAWVPCWPCSTCTELPYYFPDSSSAVATVQCNDKPCSELGNLAADCHAGQCHFSITYGDTSSVYGVLVSDDLTLGEYNTIHSYAFGCARSETVPNDLTLPPGLLGLGKGSLSLLSQSTFEQFAYCLPNYTSTSLAGSLTLGSGYDASGLSWTPMLNNKAGQSFYYVKVNGISIGGSRVSIPEGAFDSDDSTGGGFIVDSGSTISRLTTEAYGPFSDMFSQQMQELGHGVAQSFDGVTCFRVEGGMIPEVTFHFDKVDLQLNVGQVLTPLRFDDPTVLCLAFSASPDNLSRMSIFGNYQQQGMLVAFDVGEGRVGFAQKGTCT